MEHREKADAIERVELRRRGTWFQRFHRISPFLTIGALYAWCCRPVALPQLRDADTRAAPIPMLRAIPRP
jgi:hypothetical protein